MTEQHYTQEENQDLALAGVEPLMNSYMYHLSEMAPEFHTGEHKVNPNAGMCMNIAFMDGTEPADLKPGQFSTWTRHDEKWPCRVLRKRKVFIKGVWVQLFVIQLKELVKCSD